MKSNFLIIYYIVSQIIKLFYIKVNTYNKYLISRLFTPFYGLPLYFKRFSIKKLFEILCP